MAFLCKSVEIPTSNLDMIPLRCEATYLKQHAIIVRFASKLPPLEQHDLWVCELES